MKEYRETIPVGEFAQDIIFQQNFPLTPFTPLIIDNLLLNWEYFFYNLPHLPARLDNYI